MVALPTRTPLTTGVEVKINDDWQYEHYSVAEPASSLPLLYFHAQPCVGKRIVCLHIQIESETTLSMVITGNTWAFRSRLDAHGVQGGYTEAAIEGQQRTYYSLLRHASHGDRLTCKLDTHVNREI